MNVNDAIFYDNKYLSCKKIMTELISN